MLTIDNKITIAIAVIGWILFLIKWRAEIKEKKSHQQTINQLQVAGEFNKIATKLEVYQDISADLLALGSDVDKNLRSSMYLKVCGKYKSLYNEIESFCTYLLETNVKVSKSYVETKLLPDLNTYAEEQVELYRELVGYATRFEITPLIEPPRPKAYINFNKVLIKYNTGGEEGSVWSRILELRRSTGVAFD